MKKSALSAALSSNPQDAGAGQGDRAVPKADTDAFPCLAEGTTSTVTDVAAGIQKIDLSKGRRQSLAGSAPTAPRLSLTLTVRLNLYRSNQQTTRLCTERDANSPQRIAILTLPSLPLNTCIIHPPTYRILN